MLIPIDTYSLKMKKKKHENENNQNSFQNKCGLIKKHLVDILPFDFEYRPSGVNCYCVNIIARVCIHTHEKAQPLRAIWNQQLSTVQIEKLSKHSVCIKNQYLWMDVAPNALFIA